MSDRQQSGRVGAEERDRERLFLATSSTISRVRATLASNLDDSDILLTGSLLASHLAPPFYTQWQG